MMRIVVLMIMSVNVYIDECTTHQEQKGKQSIKTKTVVKTAFCVAFCLGYDVVVKDLLPSRRGKTRLCQWRP